MISAILPVSNVPSLSAMPIAFAPPAVAMCIMSSALMTAASLWIPFCMRAASFMLSSISVLLLDAAPSVPIETFTPAARLSGIGGIPEPR